MNTPTPSSASAPSALLSGRKIAILVADGFEESEFMQPREALLAADATVVVVSPNSDTVKSWIGNGFGAPVHVDEPLDTATADDFDALLLPGGLLNPDALRTHARAVTFVRRFFESGKPVAAICHGPQLLIEADVVAGRCLTSYPSIKRDLTNAGAKWSDEAVVTDQGLVTSRTPDDLPDFIAKMLEEFAEGKHAVQLA